MATLVLTTVGGIVGGPIGAALGGVLGQAIDTRLLAPKGRAGPRLTDLAVQTSSYGSAIPLVFGRMRIAGTVIWSTDLIEMRATSHAGKGQPATTSYSYAASFAVLLSGRPITGLGRIWADGNLLRGAAGDFKVACGFRLHTGGEDQPADPLIASAETAAPAARGQAYAVFENLPLADFGNRIPSLTFEVIADPEGVAIGALAAALSGDALADGGAAGRLDGFAASGNLRAGLELLAEAAGGWIATGPAGLALAGDGAAAVVVADAGYAAGARPGWPGRRTIAPADAVPRSLAVAHYDPARDYGIGLQRARRPGPGEREDRLELPAALSAGAAKTLAEAALSRADIGRVRRTLTLPADAVGIAPGAILAIDGERGRWRVDEAAWEAGVVRLELVRIAATGPAAGASPGRAAIARDAVAGATVVHAFELPALDDAVLTAPRLAIAAAGTGAGWRRASLLYSTNGGGRWIAAGDSPLPAVLGTVAVPPGRAPATLLDRRWPIEVELAQVDMVLADADAVALDAGANLAMVGDELLQFGMAERLSARRWRLSQLLRGRRGGAAIGTQAAGDRFVMIEPAALTLVDLPVTAIGGTVQVLASGAGDLAGPVTASAAISGWSVCPPPPAHLALAAGVLGWVRCSRNGFRWLDGVDVPLAEEAERYRVTLPDGGSVETSAPRLAVTAAAGDRFEVRQLGAAGASAAAVFIA